MKLQNKIPESISTYRIARTIDTSKILRRMVRVMLNEIMNVVVVEGRNSKFDISIPSKKKTTSMTSGRHKREV